jgi:flagellum-specific peptidoglycan hydrolase FlgJ
MFKFLLIAIVGFGFFAPSPYLYKVGQVPIEDKLLRLYQSNGILFPEIVLCQNKLETGYFKSKVSIENLNNFGMKNNNHGFSTGEVNGHACYSSIEAGVQDYKRWQSQMIKTHKKNFPNHAIVTQEDYLWFLDHLYINKSGADTARYAEDINYSNKLRTMLHAK